MNNNNSLWWSNLIILYISVLRCCCLQTTIIVVIFTFINMCESVKRRSKADSGTDGTLAHDAAKAVERL